LIRLALLTRHSFFAPKKAMFCAHFAPRFQTEGLARCAIENSAPSQQVRFRPYLLIWQDSWDDAVEESVQVTMASTWKKHAGGATHEGVSVRPN
jgi:hypothetical protein